AGITHDTCLALWKQPGFALRPIHISHGRPQLITHFDDRSCFHRPRLWPVHHRMWLNEMPVATPTRALFDVANEGDMHELKLERAINNAWARRLTSGELLQEMGAEWFARGRAGTAFMRGY